MMIERIERLHAHGIFRDFTWGNDLPKFAKFNLIYGQNGTGKTTLSKMLQCLELRRRPEGKVVISMDECDNIREGNFFNSDIPICVFNSDFVKDNVFSLERKGMPPIIILGEEDKEKQNLLLNKRGELAEAKRIHSDNLTNAKSTKTKLQEHCTMRAKTIKEILSGYGDGNTYGSYNARHYRKRAEKMLDREDADAYRQDETQGTLRILINDSIKPEISEPKYPESGLAVLRDLVATQLSRKVTAKTIQSLRDDPDMAKWVWQGIRLCGSSVDTCPFCEQQISEQRKLDLRRHFNSEYENVMESLDDLDASIDAKMNTYASKLKAPGCEMIYNHLFDEYRMAKDSLDSYRTRVKRYLDMLAAELKHKRRTPLDPILLDGLSDPPHECMMKSLVDVIRRHNDICRDFSRRVAEARKRIESKCVADELDDFKSLRDDMTAANNAVTESENRIAALEAEVTKLNQEVSDYGRSADALNENLRKYLGHGDIQLDVFEHGYTITRGGDFNLLPSEGEKTAIALLYFLQTLKRDQFTMEQSVVVLDDPVSSLDTNALFAAYGFIREHTGNAGQLFILTHNFTFFREIKGWFCPFPNQSNRDAQFYMLKSKKNKQGRYSEICDLDPLLKNYNSDYHYLFACVWRGANCSDTLESNYALPNMARRLLETFLAFRRPDIAGSLRKKIMDIKWDETRKRRMLEFVNAHSHNETISEQAHNMEVLSEAPNVLSDILNLMNDVDEDHYKRMVAIVK